MEYLHQSAPPYMSFLESPSTHQKVLPSASLRNRVAGVRNTFKDHSHPQRQNAPLHLQCNRAPDVRNPHKDHSSQPRQSTPPRPRWHFLESLGSRLHIYIYKKSHPSRDDLRVAQRRPTLTGGDPQLPSALKSLTSVFGMGTGVTSSPSSLDWLIKFERQALLYQNHPVLQVFFQ